MRDATDGKRPDAATGRAASRAEPTASVDLPTAVVRGESDVAAPKVGESLDRYVVVAPLGHGAMGHVMRAYDPKLRREVAIKLLRAAPDPDSAARIVREAQVMARLSHPNIVAVYDVETQAERPFIVMEYIEGQTLRDWCRETRRSAREILDTFGLAGQGLAAAHAAGVVHRDFKPSNVLCAEPNRVLVMDFGIAREDTLSELGDEIAPSSSTSSAGTLTVAGTVMGTPAYMAPEQHRGEPADARSDQYAFCVALWEALAGRRPFAGDELAAKKERLEVVEPERPLPSYLRRVLLRGLSPDPGLRFESMQPLLAALSRDRGRRRRRVFAFASLAGVVALSIAGYWIHEQRLRSACADRAASISEIWGDESRADVRRRLADASPDDGAQTFELVTPWLDRYASQWSALSERSCIAAEVEGVDRARASGVAECLELRSDELAAFVDTLREAPEGAVQWAVQGAAGLPPVDACADDEQLRRATPLPVDPRARGEVIALRRGLVRVRALVEAGRYADAESRAHRLQRRAEALGRADLEARAHFLLGILAEDAGEYDESATQFRTAFDVAARNGLDELMVDCTVWLSLVVGYRLADADEGQWWGDVGTMMAARIGAEDEPRFGDLLNSIGMVAFARGDYAVARAYQERALEQLTRTLGPNHPMVGVAHNDLAIAVEDDDNALALEHHRAALEVFERTLGPHSGQVAKSLTAIGRLLRFEGDLDGALAASRRGLEIREHAFGPDHPDVSHSLRELSYLHGEMGEHDLAIEEATRATAIIERRYGTTLPDYAYALWSLAEAYRGRGDLATAADAYERLVKVLEAIFGPMHGDVASAVEDLAEVRVQLKQLDRARDARRRVLEIRRAQHGDDTRSVGLAALRLAKNELRLDDHAAARDHLELAVSAFDAWGAKDDHAVASYFLADALWSLGEHERALPLARAAYDYFVTTDRTRDIETVGAWLAEHDGSAGDY